MGVSGGTRRRTSWTLAALAAALFALGIGPAAADWDKGPGRLRAG